MTDIPAFTVLVTGSRSWSDREKVHAELDNVVGTLGDRLVRVMHGACPKGADLFAAQWVRDRIAEGHRNLREIPVPADWDQYRKRAGILRNLRMVETGAHLCLAFIVNGSRGATHCAEAAKSKGIPVKLFTATASVTPVPERRKPVRGITGLRIEHSDGSITEEI